MAIRNRARPATALEFLDYDMTEAESAAMLFLKPGSHCGIYILDFANGQEYIGQTVDIVARYAAHRRKHHDITALQFAVCARRDLDAFEREIIHREENSGRSLRNLNLTELPGGLGDLTVTSLAGRSILLPWDRPLKRRVEREPVTSKSVRFRQLANYACYPDLRAALSLFVGGTMPNPADTQGMWVLTALPSTAGGSRLATLSVGQLEVFFARADPANPGDNVASFHINISNSDVLEARLEAISAAWVRRCSFERGPYRVAFPVLSVGCPDLATLTKLLTEESVLDAAHHLNVALMRQGSRMFTRYHNPDFATDVLRTIQHDAA